MAHYEVLVGNVGTVYRGTDGQEAVRTYLAYVADSHLPYGRAAGEVVTLWRDNEPVRESRPARLEER